MPTIDDAIREHAYHLWIKDGRQDGKADAYWLEAQRAVLSASLTRPTHFEPTQRIEPETVEAVIAATEEKYPAKKSKAAPAKKSKRPAA
jgi:hypothetical protein